MVHSATYWPAGKQVHVCSHNVCSSRKGVLSAQAPSYNKRLRPGIPHLPLSDRGLSQAALLCLILQNESLCLIEKARLQGKTRPLFGTRRSPSEPEGIWLSKLLSWPGWWHMLKSQHYREGRDWKIRGAQSRCHAALGEQTLGQFLASA